MNVICIHLHTRCITPAGFRGLSAHVGQRQPVALTRLLALAPTLDIPRAMVLVVMHDEPVRRLIEEPAGHQSGGEGAGLAVPVGHVLDILGQADERVAGIVSDGPEEFEAADG